MSLSIEVKLPCGYFRKLPGRLSQCTYQFLKEIFRKTLNKRETVLGVVISVQTR